jgi:hypothetical protein
MTLIGTNKIRVVAADTGQEGHIDVTDSGEAV